VNSNARSGASISPSRSERNSGCGSVGHLVEPIRRVRFDRGANESAMGHRHCGVTRRIQCMTFVISSTAIEEKATDARSPRTKSTSL
jgi:hypothetical protein